MLAFVFIFLLGTIIGSFLNVVIYRFGSGRSVSHGRSMCMTCSKTLQWYELIPVLSFVLQRGRCLRCKSTISFQYPLVEVSTGIIFALIAFHFLPYLSYSYPLFVFLVILFSLIFSLLIVITVYDIRHKIIPNKLVYLYAFISFLSIFINTTSDSLFVKPTFGALVAGPLCALPFALLWLISRGKWMGLGDAKLILGIGWMLGITGALAALTLSFWVGSVVSLAIMFFAKRSMTMKTQIPFAPFLIIGTAIVFFFNLNIFSFALLFQK
jgi:prepilin signal peptidase PulO-like enzyme (type II secretory pathway)